MRLVLLCLLMLVLLAPGCSEDENDREPDASTESDADAGFEREICPEDGSFAHLEPGECTDGEGGSFPCIASGRCLAADHCVGQGGAGSPDSCRTMECGVIDCAPDCTCVAESVCEC